MTDCEWRGFNYLHGIIIINNTLDGRRRKLHNLENKTGEAN